ncbi:MAG: hypothetical protein WCX07_04820 [Dehalococcoidales bacterium]
MREYDEIYGETIPFKFMYYIIIGEGATGILFLVFFFLQSSGSFIPDADASAVFWLIMAIVMLAVTAFLTTLTKLDISITQDKLKASFGLIKFETPLTNIADIYSDDRAGITYGGWGVRVARLKQGMTLAYSTFGYKRVVVELKTGKYKLFVFSASNPEEFINVIKNRMRRF